MVAKLIAQRRRLGVIVILLARLVSEQLEDGGWNCEAENGSVRSCGFVAWGDRCKRQMGDARTRRGAQASSPSECRTALQQYEVDIEALFA